MTVALFSVFVALLLLSVPIAVSIGIACIIPFLINPHFPANTAYVIRGLVSGADSTPVLAIPLFILSGVIMARGGISKKLFDVFTFFLGKRTAGMPAAAIVTCLFYGAISGSGPATTAAVGAMTIPVLLQLGYDKVFCAALVATAGGLGVIIPPSIPFVTYGLSTGASVGDLFIAGVFPGILIALCLILYAWIYCKKHGEDREKINAAYGELRKKGFFKLFREGFWALLTPVIILGGIYSGLTTPTEAACVSVFYALIVCLFIDKTLRFNELIAIFVESARTYAPLCMLLALAMGFGRVLALLRAPDAIAAFVTGTFPGKISFLIAINIVFLIAGMLMDTGPAIIILSPMLMPAIAALGIDLIHFGIIMVVNLAIGFVTPPFGVNLFVASPLTGIPVMQIGKKAYPFIFAFIIALALITFVPAISLFL